MATGPGSCCPLCARVPAGLPSAPHHAGRRGAGPRGRRAAWAGQAAPGTGRKRPPRQGIQTNLSRPDAAGTASRLPLWAPAGALVPGRGSRRLALPPTHPREGRGRGSRAGQGGTGMGARRLPSPRPTWHPRCPGTGPAPLQQVPSPAPSPAGRRRRRGQDAGSGVKGAAAPLWLPVGLGASPQGLQCRAPRGEAPSRPHSISGSRTGHPCPLRPPRPTLRRQAPPRPTPRLPEASAQPPGTHWLPDLSVKCVLPGALGAWRDATPSCQSNLIPLGRAPPGT